MPTTPIGNTFGPVIPELQQELKSDLANNLNAGPRSQHVRAGGAEASNSLANAGQSFHNAPPGPTPVTDVAAVLLAEVASSDVTKLARILDPAPDPVSNKVLDALLQRAVAEVAAGNPARAVGYLADYATRDPRRAEALPAQPDLEPVRDKIDSMVNRMANVARMSALEGLSKAEQTASEMTGKITNWDTHPDVLVKLASRLFEAGGYANYSRSSELAKIVTGASIPARESDHTLAAAASAGAPLLQNAAAAQMVAGANVPYWASPEYAAERPVFRTTNDRQSRISTAASGTLRQNLQAFKEISSSALRQLWQRAPLLVLMLVWFAAGIVGGTCFAIGCQIWPDGSFVPVGNLAFNLWALGFLALVGLGFYARTRTQRR